MFFENAQWNVKLCGVVSRVFHLYIDRCQHSELLQRVNDLMTLNHIGS